MFERQSPYVVVLGDTGRALKAVMRSDVEVVLWDGGFIGLRAVTNIRDAVEDFIRNSMVGPLNAHNA